MSYEHCDEHGMHAPDHEGCPKCRQEELAGLSAAQNERDAACGVPLTDIATCTRSRGHEGNCMSHGSYAPPLVPRAGGRITKREDTEVVAIWRDECGDIIPDGDDLKMRTAEEPDLEISVPWEVFGAGARVALVLAAELDAVVDLAARAEEEAKQRAGAVRHLEATRAELVKVTAERDGTRTLLLAEGVRLAAALEERDSAQRMLEEMRKLVWGVNQGPQRRRLPTERQGVTHAFAIHTPDGRHKGYVTVGLYDDGTVGEVFLKLDQQGSQVSGFCDAWSIAVSMLLQTGTSLEVVCRKFRSMRFEPSGRTETPGIRVADSPVDYAARYLEHRFVRGLQLTDEAPAGAPEGEV